MMITVSISINGNVIYARTAVNISKSDDEINSYKLDTGRIIKHNQSDGAIVLAKKMLKTINEV